MKFKTGELLYPSKRYGVVGRSYLSLDKMNDYEHVPGDAAGVFIEYTTPQNFEINIHAPRVLMLILVQDKPLLFNKGGWRRRKQNADEL